MFNYNFYTYILTNYNRKVLYTGVISNLEGRLCEHYWGLNNTEGKISFTTKYQCFYLVWYERHQYIQHAIEREKEIKGWIRNKKIKLIEKENPNWEFLNQTIMDWPPEK